MTANESRVKKLRFVEKRSLALSCASDNLILISSTIFKAFLLPLVNSFKTY